MAESPNLDGANEQDVREDVAAPLLAALGYRRGTAAEILRERTLRYERVFLGRKKDSDPPLIGRADYVLQVLGAGRWTLEVKAPDVELGVDAIEQAITYARHPEVSGTYAALLNGRHFLLFGASQRAAEAPLLRLAVGAPNELAEALKGILSPAAIRRDCTPRAVDTSRPLAEGLRSRARILRGQLHREFVEWESSLVLPETAVEQFDELTRRLREYTSTIAAGEMWRDESSRVRAKIQWTAPHAAVAAFSDKHNWGGFEYVALDSDISRDATRPTTMEVVGEVRIEAGEELFDIQRWAAATSPISAETSFRGQAIGWLDGDIFSGRFVAEYLTIAPLGTVLVAEGGTFSVTVDVA